MKTLDEFKSSGGKLTGASGTHGVSREEYDGAPRQYNEKLSTTFDKLGLGKHHQQTDSGVGGVGSHTTSGTGHHGVGTGAAGAGVAAAGVGAAAHHRRRGSNSSYSSSSDESVGGTRRKKDRLSRRAVGTGAGGVTGAGSTGTTGTTGTSTGQHKPGLMDRLNPRKDADGDGKAGFND